MNKQKNEKTGFNKKWLLIAVIPLIAAVWNISDDFTSGYYHQPLILSPELAANFGEVRENHFHMGLDIRTNGKENLPVYAAADGYVSKVTIEEAGFGRAIYITHPNGTITVYAHLNRFMDRLEAYVKAKQYRDECWQQDINLAPNRFPVRGGEQIALSGNTGTTEGPHLHFEIRNAHTGDNMNPLLAGMNILDHVTPVINGLYWYDRTGSIYSATAEKMALHGDGDSYNTQQQVVIVSSPRISLGIEATDKNAATKYRLGIYKADVYMDGQPRFNFALNNINYADTRYVNSCIDYGSWINYGKSIQLLCTLPGNRLPAYNSAHETGVLNLADRKVHSIKITVSDAAGNIAAIHTVIKYDGTPQVPHGHKKNIGVLLPGKASNVATQNARVSFSARALYDTVNLQMTEENNGERNAASPAIFIHDATVPVHDSFLIKIKTTLAANDPLRAHVVMQLTNEKHNIIFKGKWSGDYMKGYCMEMGTVQLIIDTVAPDINLQEGNNSTFTNADKAMHVIYKDNAGEAAFFRAGLDGHWVLFEKKGAGFTYYFDGHCAPGPHTLKIIAGDKAGNVTQREFRFVKQ